MTLKQRLPRLKALFMSGYTSAALAHHIGDLRASTHLEKPIRPAALLTKIREVLEDKAAVRA